MLPEWFVQRIHSKPNAKISHIEYDRFVFPDDYKWSLAFYKLNALSHMLEKGCDRICYLDVDVFVQGNFDNIWKECDYNILLYDINDGLGTSDYYRLCAEYKAYTGVDKTITHYGGEFFAANRDNAQMFANEMNIVYKKMIATSFKTETGDEFIVSVAAEALKLHIKNAGAYVYRYWTGNAFRLISSNYRYNAVTVLHMPNEKEKGLVSICDKYYLKGKKPTKEFVWKKCRLQSQPMVDRAKTIVKAFLFRIGKTKGIPND